MKVLGRWVKWLLCVGWLVPLGTGIWLFMSTAIRMLEYMAGSGQAGWPEPFSPATSMAPEQFIFAASQVLVAVGLAWLAVVVCIWAWRFTTPVEPGVSA